MDLKSFTDEIKSLDSQHKKGIEAGLNLSGLGDWYKNNIESIIYEASACEEWPEIVKHISFLIYAGGFMEIGLEKTISRANVAVQGKEDAEKREIMAKMEAHVASDRAHRLATALKSAPSLWAKNAVSNRADQKLKQPFMEFCKKLIAEEKHHAIKTINDLLSTDGCDVAFKTTVDERSLKTWTKECGFTFRAGRPARN